MELINEQIKEQYGSKTAFCSANNLDYTNFPKKMASAERKIKWLNDLLKPLNLRVVIERCS